MQSQSPYGLVYHHPTQRTFAGPLAEFHYSGGHSYVDTAQLVTVTGEVWTALNRGHFGNGGGHLFTSGNEHCIMTPEGLAVVTESANMSLIFQATAEPITRWHPLVKGKFIVTIRGINDGPRQVVMDDEPMTDEQFSFLSGADHIWQQRLGRPIPASESFGLAKPVTPLGARNIIQGLQKCDALLAVPDDMGRLAVQRSTSTATTPFFRIVGTGGCVQQLNEQLKPSMIVKPGYASLLRAGQLVRGDETELVTDFGGVLLNTLNAGQWLQSATQRRWIVPTLPQDGKGTGQLDLPIDLMQMITDGPSITDGRMGV